MEVETQDHLWLYKSQRKDSAKGGAEHKGGKKKTKQNAQIHKRAGEAGGENQRKKRRGRARTETNTGGDELEDIQRESQENR